MGTVLWAFCEIGTVTPVSAGEFESTGEADADSEYDTAYARGAIKVDSSGNYFQSPNWVQDGEDFLGHFEMDQDNFSASSSLSNVIIFYSASNVAVLRLQNSSSSNITNFDYWNGLAWVNAGSTTAFSPDSPQIYDLRIKVNSASGQLRLFSSGTELITFTGDLSSVPAIRYARCYRNSADTTGRRYWSQGFFIEGESTIGRKLMTWAISGAGHVSDWSGSSTSSNVSELRYNDGTNIISNTGNQVAMFAGSLVGSLAGRAIRAFGVFARANADLSGIQKLQVAVRVNSVDYFSGDITLGLGFGAHGYIWEENPELAGLEWGTTVPSEIGVKSIP